MIAQPNALCDITQSASKKSANVTAKLKEARTLSCPTDGAWLNDVSCITTACTMYAYQGLKCTATAC
eukprot:m.361740 g.361740  ORF g.361740 m.361740 type:complete len:67 (-) comp19851_c0_seq1:131-331(-)